MSVITRLIGFIVVAYRRAEQHLLSEIQQAILECLKDGPLDRESIIKWLEESDLHESSRADEYIDKLLERGLIEEEEQEVESKYSGDLLIDDDDEDDWKEGPLKLADKGRRRLYKSTKVKQQHRK